MLAASSRGRRAPALESNPQNGKAEPGTHDGRHALAGIALLLLVVARFATLGTWLTMREPAVPTAFRLGQSSPESISNL